jgi:hypothetical protein
MAPGCVEWQPSLQQRDHRERRGYGEWHRREIRPAASQTPEKYQGRGAYNQRVAAVPDDGIKKRSFFRFHFQS